MRPAGQESRNILIKRQKAAGFDQGEKAAIDAGFRDDPFNFCDRKVTPRSCFDRFVIDDPVAHPFVNRLQIGPGKVINRIRLVIVN